MTQTVDYCKLMIDWQNQLQQKVRQRFPSDDPLHDFTKHYHAEIHNRDTLVITLGDSWTWGASLQQGLRLQQVYGALIKNQLDADWINIGCQGWSNSFILGHLDLVLNLLEKNSYKKIYVIVTLTENGRDLTTFPHFKFNYQQLHNKLGSCAEFYNTLLDECETHWIKQIQQAVGRMDSRFHVVVGQNFVWHQVLVDQLQDQVQILDLNWIECLADKQQLPRPLRTNLVTGWIFDSIDTVNSLLEIKDTTEFKRWSLPYIEKATEVNQWLQASDLNFKLASKHPTDQGHRVWTDYILKNLK